MIIIRGIILILLSTSIVYSGELHKYPKHSGSSNFVVVLGVFKDRTQVKSLLSIKDCNYLDRHPIRVEKKNGLYLAIVGDPINEPNARRVVAALRSCNLSPRLMAVN